MFGCVCEARGLAGWGGWGGPSTSQMTTSTGLGRATPEGWLQACKQAGAATYRRSPPTRFHTWAAEGSRSTPLCLPLFFYLSKITLISSQSLHVAPILSKCPPFVSQDVALAFANVCSYLFNVTILSVNVTHVTGSFLPLRSCSVDLSFSCLTLIVVYVCSYFVLL